MRPSYALGARALGLGLGLGLANPNPNTLTLTPTLTLTLTLEELAAFLQASQSCIVSGEGITASTTSARYTTPRCRVPRQHSYLLTYFLQAAAAYLTPADPPNFSGVRSLAQALKGTRACCS